MQSCPDSCHPTMPVRRDVPVPFVLLPGNHGLSRILCMNHALRSRTVCPNWLHELRLCLFLICRAAVLLGRTQTHLGLHVQPWADSEPSASVASESLKGEIGAFIPDSRDQTKIGDVNNILHRAREWWLGSHFLPAAHRSFWVYLLSWYIDFVECASA